MYWPSSIARITSGLIQYGVPTKEFAGHAIEADPKSATKQMAGLIESTSSCESWCSQHCYAISQMSHQTGNSRLQPATKVTLLRFYYKKYQQLVPSCNVKILWSTESELCYSRNPRLHWPPTGGGSKASQGELHKYLVWPCRCQWAVYCQLWHLCEYDLHYVYTPGQPTCPCR